MSDIIHLLPDSIANQIAAGEVIQRPASVVKELLENSVDAGARNIRLDVQQAGRESIRVTDDGKGMSPNDARMAFERHATSKISSVEGLYTLLLWDLEGKLWLLSLQWRRWNFLHERYLKSLVHL